MGGKEKKKSQGWTARRIDLSGRLIESIKDQQSCFGYVYFEMPLRHPSGDADFVVGYICLEFRGGFWARDLTSGIINRESIFTAEIRWGLPGAPGFSPETPQELLVREKRNGRDVRRKSREISTKDGEVAIWNVADCGVDGGLRSDHWYSPHGGQRWSEQEQFHRGGGKRAWLDALRPSEGAGIRTVNTEEWYSALFAVCYKGAFRNSCSSLTWPRHLSPWFSSN